MVQTSMALPTLTEREKRILFLIRVWQHQRRYTPSMQEIGDLFGVRKSTIGVIIKGLKEKGYIDVSMHKNWRKRLILFPEGMKFPWGNEKLPDELFDHMEKLETMENVLQ